MAQEWVQGRAKSTSANRPPERSGEFETCRDSGSPEWSAARLAAIVESSSDAIISHDFEGTIQSWNRGAERLYGYAAEEAVGMSIYRFVPSDCVDEIKGCIDQVRRGNRVESFQTRRVRASGEVLDVAIALSPIRDENGVAAVSAIERDVSEQRRAKERLRIAVEVAKVGTFEWNVQGDVNIWTPELEALYGLTPGTFGGSYAAWIARVHPDDRESAEAAVREALHSGSLVAEWRTAWPDGTVRWLEARAWTEQDASGKPLRMIGVNVDVTERKEAEEALKEESRRKDDYLAMLGHELRNPLAAIRTTGELIGLASEGAPELERAAAVLERQSAHMAKLLDGLLDVSRITRGQLKTDKSNIDLVPILQNVHADHIAQATRKGVELRLELPGVPLPLEGDAARLTQVVDNLLSNAIKFTEPEGTVTLEGAVQRQEAVVVVQDTGVGFSSELRNRLFDSLQQGPQSLARSQGGLGLGLTLTRGLVELHGGRITGHSDGLGRGARFEVRLPLSEVSRPASSKSPRAEGNGGGVLLIEDNADAAEMLCRILELSGHEVTTVARGDEGVDIARAKRPDVVLCDLGLPGEMTGFDVAQRLRSDEETRHLKLVALSGYGRPEDKARATEAGFDQHLTKPVDLAALERVLRQP